MALFNFTKGGDTPTPEAIPDSPTNPGAVDTKAAPEPKLTGLDRLQQMLDNDPTGGKENPDGSQDPGPFNPEDILSNKEVMDKIKSGIDFSQSISKETQQKLADGSPDAIVSLVQDVSMQAYETAMKHSSVLFNRAMDDRLSRLEKSTETSISNSLSKHELHQQLPELNNPLVKMAVGDFQAKLQAQNPSITAAQVAAETKTYVAELAKVLNPTKPDTSKEPVDTDWFKELGIN